MVFFLFCSNKLIKDSRQKHTQITHILYLSNKLDGSIHTAHCALVCLHLLYYVGNMRVYTSIDVRMRMVAGMCVCVHAYLCMFMWFYIIFFLVLVSVLSEHIYSSHTDTYLST